MQSRMPLLVIIAAIVFIATSILTIVLVDRAAMPYSEKISETSQQRASVNINTEGQPKSEGGAVVFDIVKREEHKGDE